MTMTNKNNNKIRITKQKRSGVALLLALIVLVVLTSVVYKLVSDISALRHRQEYLIDYQKARYACDSAMKFGISLLPKTAISLAKEDEHPDLPNFSDEFQMDQETYENILRQWYDIAEETDNSMDDTGATDPNSMDIADLFAKLMGETGSEQSENIDNLYLPGPYTFQWPNVIAPIEYEINEIKVTISIEDENAKFPLIWATHAGNEETQKAATASLETFCVWMGMDEEQIKQLFEEANQIAEYKQFRLSYPAITVTETVKATKSAKKSRRSRNKKTAVKKTVKKQREPEEHARDFAQLILSSIVDIDALSETMWDMGNRHETPMKYLGIWGADKVNVNTAPRHVLEAAFTFGGKAEEIADEIIRLRREEPFASLDDMKEKMYGYNDSIQNAKSYICFKSEYFSIKATASSGKAKTVMMAAVIKDKKDIKKIATFVY